MKSRSEIWLHALEELGAANSVSTIRDVTTFTNRLKQEGESFLTLTLPSFAKDFEQSLALESIPIGAFAGFARSRFVVKATTPNGARTNLVSPVGAPKFLGGFMDLVFSRSISVGVSSSQNELLGSVFVPQVVEITDKEHELRIAKAIAAVRQLTLMFSKEKELCSESKQTEAIAEYIRTDASLNDPLIDDRADILFEGNRLERTKRIIRIVYGNALSKVDSRIYYEQLIPKHGPGSTADRLQGNQKWTFPEWHDRLEYLFPFGTYAIPNLRFSRRYTMVKHVAPWSERPVKVVLVPKTQKSPRLIAIEPTCMQYIQQAISRELVDCIERDSLATRFVGFEDQTINNVMAHKGSEDQSFATLDLSEASDRVSNWLVKDLFSDFPHFSEGIQACRSQRAMLPSGQVIDLLKFASMGSALTFPIEAIVFSAIVIERILSASDKPISFANVLALTDSVRVYGDDIIIPNEHAAIVIDGLETFGFKVNRSKSFWTGWFRESCGKEYWRGHDVSLVKFRTKLPTSLRDVNEVISTVATRNQLYKAGLKRTAYLLDVSIRETLNGHYPIVGEKSSILGRIDDTIRYDIHGFWSSTQSPFVKGYKMSSKLPINGIDDDYALMKCLLESIGSPNTDKEHLTRSGRPQAVSLKLVKASPF